MLCLLGIILRLESFKENFEKIYVFKCCIISDLKEQNKKIIKSEIKIPVFNEQRILGLF